MLWQLWSTSSWDSRTRYDVELYSHDGHLYLFLLLPTLWNCSWWDLNSFLDPNAFPHWFILHSSVLTSCLWNLPCSSDASAVDFPWFDPMCVFRADADVVAKWHSGQLCTDVVLNVDIPFVSLERSIDGGVLVVCVPLQECWSKALRLMLSMMGNRLASTKLNVPEVHFYH